MASYNWDFISWDPASICRHSSTAGRKSSTDHCTSYELQSLIELFAPLLLGHWWRMLDVLSSSAQSESGDVSIASILEIHQALICSLPYAVQLWTLHRSVWASYSIFPRILYPNLTNSRLPSIHWSVSLRVHTGNKRIHRNRSTEYRQMFVWTHLCPRLCVIL